jgi:hypothetical protein
VWHLSRHERWDETVSAFPDMPTHISEPCLHAEPLKGFELGLRMEIHTVDQCAVYIENHRPQHFVASILQSPGDGGESRPG